LKGPIFRIICSESVVTGTWISTASSRSTQTRWTAFMREITPKHLLVLKRKRKRPQKRKQPQAKKTRKERKERAKVEKAKVKAREVVTMKMLEASC